MVVEEMALTHVATQCTICKAQVQPWDRAFIVVRMPSLESHMLCAECWSVVMASSYAWLMAEDDDAPEILKRRIRAALALFADKKASRVVPGKKGPAPAS